MYSAEEKRMHPLQWCDLELYQLGEFDRPVKDYAFTIKAGRLGGLKIMTNNAHVFSGGKFYTIQVNLMEMAQFFISKDWECKVYETVASFRVNGMKGWGGAEWEYRNLDGRAVN